MTQPYAALLATQRETDSTFIAIRRDLHAHSESGFEETRAVQHYGLPGNGVGQAGGAARNPSLLAHADSRHRFCRF